MMKKGKWSKEEDNLIKNHIEKYGIGRSWQDLSNTLGLQRCGRSCRSRWLNYLRPGLKHGNFTPAEEAIICEMYSKRGSCWSVIAAQLPGRTDLAIKNYWNSTLKKKFPAARASAAAHRRRNRPACSTSSDSGTPAQDLQLISYSSQESSTPGSSPVKPVVLAGLPPVQTVQPPPAPLVAGVQEPIAGVLVTGPVKTEAAVSRPLLEKTPAAAPLVAGVQEPIAAVPVTGPVKIEAVVSRPILEKTPPPPPPACDQTGEMVMDIVCVPMSPVPLSIMAPDELACIYQFDDIDSFLTWFDDN